MNNPLAPQNEVAEVRQVDSVYAIRDVALRQIEQIKELKEKQKHFTEMKKNILENDQDLTHAQSQAEELLEAIKTAKAKVKKQSDYVQAELNEKDVKEEIAEIGESLSGHLISYSALTGSNYIETAEGKQMKIKHKVSVHSGQQRLF
jgi:hypothetical protein